MRVLLLNSRFGSGSTGRICKGITDALKQRGHEAYVAYGLGITNYKNSYKITNKLEVYFHVLLSRVFDAQGLFSILASYRLIKYIKQIKPDVINIHTIHGSYLNYPRLFRYLNKTKIKVVWTLHDCWSFTGHCAHFYECNKWKSQCSNCPYIKEYPQSYFLDRSRANFNHKKRLFTQLGNRLTIVPVSKWLSGLVSESFFKNNRNEIIHNGVDVNQFKIIEHPQFRRERHLEDKIIILGVALPWSKYKGLKDFFVLRSMLPDKYTIVLVGLDAEQRKSMLPGMLGLGRTDSIEELVDIYNSADLFVNPTYQDTFPTVNLEAMACGTPVITYTTGGSPEAITDETGDVIKQGDTDALYNSILSFDLSHLELVKCKCRENVLYHYHKESQFLKYVDLFESLV